MVDAPRIDIWIGDDDSDDEKVQETNLDDLEDDENEGVSEVQKKNTKKIIVKDGSVLV